MNANPIQSAGRLHLESMATAYAALIASQLSAGSVGKKALEVFESRFPRSLHLGEVRSTVEKAAVSVGSTTSWGAALSSATPLASAFLSYVRAATVLGRMDGLRRVPLNIKIPRQTSSAVIGWVAEGAPKPISGLTFDGITLPPAKCGAICVVSRELAQSSDPSAVEVVRNDLKASVVQFSDANFLNPAVGAVVGVSPASITHDATEIPSSGIDGAAFASDFQKLVSAASAGGLLNPYLICRPEVAVGLCGLDIQLTADCGVVDGSIGKIPVLCSASAPQATLVLVDASQVLVAEGELEVSASEQAALQMASLPDVPPSAATILRSLWTENLHAILVVRYINWLAARTNCVAYMSGLDFTP